jgi:hypothetical protein
VAETLAELRAELASLEKRLSQVCQQPGVGSITMDLANHIAAVRVKIKMLEGRAG